MKLHVRLFFHLGNPYMNCSIIVTPSHIVIFEDFIRWIFFTDSKTPMCLLGSVRIQDLKNIVSGHNILVFELLIIHIELKLAPM